MWFTSLLVEIKLFLYVGKDIKKFEKWKNQGFSIRLLKFLVDHYDKFKYKILKFKEYW